MSDKVKIVVEGAEYDVERGQGELRLSDGRLVVLKWVETFPETFGGHEIVSAEDVDRATALRIERGQILGPLRHKAEQLRDDAAAIGSQYPVTVSQYLQAAAVHEDAIRILEEAWGVQKPKG